MPQISWGNAVLAATYRGLCSAVTRPTSKEAILLGCPLLLQMWIHERFDIGRPSTDLSEYEAAANGTDPADLPTIGSLWCLRKVMTSLYVILRVMASVCRPPGDEAVRPVPGCSRYPLRHVCRLARTGELPFDRSKYFPLRIFSCQ
jgi:hypothetical protein